jgi:hypothetical protein
MEATRAVNIQTAAVVPACAPDYHVDPRAPASQQAPKLGRAAVTEQRSRSTRVNSSNEGGANAHRGAAHRIYAPVQQMQAPIPDPMADRIPSEPETGKLQMAHNTMLPGRHVGHREVNWLL